MYNGLFIERIDIGAFGGVSQKSISLGNGINLITANNEAGKSTIAAAIKFALYGFKGRSAVLAENPKKMYMPWSGAAASVAITIGGSKRVRVERTVNGTKEQAQCTDLVTGNSLYTGLCFGEELFGISADTFDKSLFFSTLYPPESKDTELASALQNLVFSADEQTSTEKASKVLTSHKNALKGRTTGSGEIARLELDEQMLEEKLLHEKKVMSEISALEEAANKTQDYALEKEQVLKQLEIEKYNYEKYRAQLILLEYNSIKEKEAEAKKDLNDALYPDITLETIEECRAAREEKKRTLALLKEAKEQHREATLAIPSETIDENKLTKAHKACKSSKAISIFLILAGILVCVIGVALLSVLLEKLAAYIAICVGLLLVAAAVAASFASSAAVKKAGFKKESELNKAVSNIPHYRAEIDSLKQQEENAGIRVQQATAEYEKARQAFATLVPTECDDEIDIMYAGYVYASNLRVAVKAAETAVASFEAVNNIEELTALAVNAVKPQKSREQIETEYKFAYQAASGLKEKLNDIRNKIAILKSAGNDPCITESKLLWTRTMIAEKKIDYKALTLALDELAAASDEMRSSISPRIASIASNYFLVATSGKYRSIELDTRLYMSYQSEIGNKSAEHLSAGTRETAYLCLRLALIKLLYGEKNMPVMLDDAFAHTDDLRLKELIGLFIESGNQVVITSCTDREEKALKAIGAEYKNVNL